MNHKATVTVTISDSLFHYFIISLFHYFIISLFHYFIISLFHHFIISSLQITKWRLVQTAARHVEPGHMVN